MHSLFIVPVSAADWFNEQAIALGNGGPALVLALSRNGQEPATHGWCAVKLSAENEALVQQLMVENPDKNVIWRQYDLGVQVDFVSNVLIDERLKVISRELF